MGTRKTVWLHIPEDLKRQVEAKAEAEYRSVNRQIEMMIRQGLQQDQSHRHATA